jgi:hypothetical protein
VDEKTRQIFDRDALAEAEQIFGKTVHTFSSEELIGALAITFRAGEEASRHFKALGDTHFGIAWTHFKALLAWNGFLLAFANQFQSGDHGERTEEEIICYHPAKGLVLYADSFLDNVNSGRYYGMVRAKEETKRDVWETIGTGGCWDKERPANMTSARACSPG